MQNIEDGGKLLLASSPIGSMQTACCVFLTLAALHLLLMTVLRPPDQLYWQKESCHWLGVWGVEAVWSWKHTSFLPEELNISLLWTLRKAYFFHLLIFISDPSTKGNFDRLGVSWLRHWNSRILERSLYRQTGTITHLFPIFSILISLNITVKVEASNQHLAFIYPKSLECSGGNSSPSPLPNLSPNHAASQKAQQMMTLPLEMLNTTPTGCLNVPLENRHVVFLSCLLSRELEDQEGALCALNLGVF